MLSAVAPGQPPGCYTEATWRRGCAMVTPADEPSGVTIREISHEESWAMLDADCRAYLGISAREFADRYNRGEYDDPDHDTKLMRLAMRLEFLQPSDTSR